MALTLNAQARLITMPDHRVLWRSKRLAFESRKAMASDWTAQHAHLLASEIDRGLDALARQVGDGPFGAASTARASSANPAAMAFAQR